MSGPFVDRLVLMAAALTVALSAWWWLRTKTTTLVILWAVVLGFVPFWFGLTVRSYFQPASLVGLLLLACLWGRVRTRTGWADLGVGLFFLICLLPAAFGLATASTIFQVVTQWMVGFLVGRLLPARVGLARVQVVLGIAMALVGLLAVTEFLLSWNPYADLTVNNALYAQWSNLQERGGVLRAEWAFGHSIALGACLGLTVPLVLTAPLHWAARAAMLLPILAGAIVSFSRIGMITTIAGAVLSVIFLRSGLPARLRAVVSIGLVAVAVVATPVVTRTFSEAGSEATNSAAYRGDLSSLVPAFSVIGFTDDASRTASGELYFGQFQSIDSAFILMGLTYGWLALIAASALLLAAVVTLLRGRATPATVAIVAHLPALATVALITQYSIFFWFVVGLAAFGAPGTRQASAARSIADSSPTDEPERRVGWDGSDKLGLPEPR